MTGILRGPRRAALVAITVLVAGASLVSFAESYHALYLWAARHGAGGDWALIWPAMVDVFIAVGELSLFVAMIDRWEPRNRALAWGVTLAGLAVSVAGNIGHVASPALSSRATAAVPPLAATAALAVGLGVLKRVARQAAPEDAGAAEHGAPALPAVPAPGADVALSGAPDDVFPSAPDDATVSGHLGMPGATRPRETARHARDTTRHKRRTQADIEAEALAVLSRLPGISGAELGRSVGVSGRTGQRLLTRLTNEREPASTDDT